MRYELPDDHDGVGRHPQNPTGLNVGVLDFERGGSGDVVSRVVLGEAISDEDKVTYQKVLSPATADDARHMVIDVDRANRHVVEQEVALAQAIKNREEASKYQAAREYRVDLQAEQSRDFWYGTDDAGGAVHLAGDVSAGDVSTPRARCGRRH